MFSSSASKRAREAVGSPPLCVDLDGTLLQTDTAQERFVLLLQRDPWRLAQLPLWLWRGRPAFKYEMASRTRLPVEQLPVSTGFLEFLHAERAIGRRLILATGADAKSAAEVARRFGIFDEILSTDREINLTAERKRRRLVDRFGEKGFDYAGNSRADLPVWRAAREAIAVNAPATVLRRARSIANVTRVFEPPRSGAAGILQVLEPGRWIENLLLVIPFLTTGGPARPGSPAALALALAAFCLCSSSASIINALGAIGENRNASRTRSRPLASGQTPIMEAVVLAPVLLLAGGLAAAFLSPMFWLWLIVFYTNAIMISPPLGKPSLPGAGSDAWLLLLRVLAGYGAAGLPCQAGWLAGWAAVFLGLEVWRREAGRPTLGN